MDDTATSSDNKNMESSVVMKKIKGKRKRHSGNSSNKSGNDRTNVTSQQIPTSSSSSLLLLSSNTIDSHSTTMNEKYSKTHHYNPFLLHYKSSMEDEHNDEDDEQESMFLLLDHISTLTRTTISHHELSPKHTHEDSLQYIIQYLQQKLKISSSSSSTTLTMTHDQTFIHQIVSPIEIIQVVLPWCMTHVQQQQPTSCPNIVVWEAINTSISMLSLLQQQSPTTPSFSTDETKNDTTKSSSSSSTVTVSKLVSQSILFKLVPKMIQWMTMIETNSSTTLTTATLTDNDNNNRNVESVGTTSPILVTYNSLLPLFQPTMEVACKHVLLPLLKQQEDEQLQGDGTTKKLLLPMLVLPSTLHWIYMIHTSRKGNPKTTFQLFSDLTIIMALSKCYSMFLYKINSNENDDTMVSLLNEFMYDIYFHPKHHMEGFITILRQKPSPPLNDDTTRTTNTTLDDHDNTLMSHSTLFRTYHYDLLDTIQTQITSFCLDSSCFETEKSSMSIIQLLPVLFRGFVQQSNLYWNDKKGKGNDTTITRIQYQLFTRWTRPLISILQSWSNQQPSMPHTSTIQIGIVISSMRQLVQVVFDQNIFVPTTAVSVMRISNDENGTNSTDARQYQLLKDIVSTMFNVNTTLANETKLHQELLIKQNMIHALQIIFQLHHLLLQDHMIDALQLCLSIDSSISNENTNDDDIVTEFIVTMITTYRQLRQQQLIFQNIFAVIDSLQTGSLASSLNHIQHLIYLFTSKQKIIDAVSHAMINCPIEETKSIFHTCNDWMIQVCDKCRSDCSENSDHSRLRDIGLEVMIPLLTMVTRNVRVANGTASVIATCCQVLVQNSITKLSESKNENWISGFIPTAIILTGLLVELHMHSVFWLGSSESLTIPKNISDRIGSIDTQCDHDSYQLHQSVIFLSCHRLKQLHSLIYEQEVAAMETQVSNGDIIASLIAEAQRNASFIATKLDHTNSTKEHRWIAVAQNLSSWIVYAEKDDIIQFLKWVVAVSSKSMVHTPKIMGRPLVSAPHSVNLNFNLDETEVVKCLLTDNAFFQYLEVDSLISMVGLSLVAELIVNTLLLSNRSSCDNIELRSFIDTPLTDDGYQRLEQDAIFNPDYKYKKVPLGTCAYTGATLQQALNVANLVVELPMSSCTDEDLWNFFDLTLRLDHVYSSLDAGTALLPKLALLSTSTRLLLTKVLARSSVSSVQNMIRDYLPFCDLLFGLIDSTRNHISRFHSIDDSHVARLMESTGCFIETLLLKVQLDADLAQQMTHEFSRIKQLFNDSGSLCTLVYMSRRIVVAMKSLEQIPTETFAKLFDDMWDIAISSCERECKRHMAENEDDRASIIRPIVPFTSSEGFLLLGDLIDVKKSPVEDVDRVLNDLHGTCVVLLRRSMSNELTALEWSSLCYLTGRIATKRPSMELFECILTALQFDGYRACNTQVLEACICQMVTTLTGDRLLSVIAALASQSNHAIDRRLRLLTLLLRYIHDPNLVKLLSSLGRNMFIFTLSGLCLKRGDLEWYDTVVASCTLLEDLIKRRDLLSLKERDLALILSYISGVLVPIRKENLNENIVSEIEELNVFISVSDLFVTIFQRYTKNLYVCAPSAISLIHCMLRHTMHNSQIVSRQSITIRGQHVTRICELTVGHKEVYKKHVVGLVLVFISGIEQATLSLHCREALTPAIYFLLDCMSTFEMQQLNAQMNSKARILFRNVHQNYEKLHTYKGQ